MSANEDLVRVLQELRDEVRQLRAEVRALGGAPAPRLVSVRQACAAVGVSRSTFDRWLSDRGSGLADVVVRPGGPRGRVLVPLAEFERWLADRGRPGDRVRAPASSRGRGPRVASPRP